MYLKKIKWKKNPEEKEKNAHKTEKWKVSALEKSKLKSTDLPLTLGRTVHGEAGIVFVHTALNN